MQVDHKKHPTPEISVSIIITTYNTAALVEQAVASIEQTTEVSYETIVIDNASLDDTEDRMSQFPSVRYIRLDRNHGFARANNLGALLARGKYLLLVNSDVILRTRGIDELINFAERHPESRIWGARTLYPDLNLNPTYCWRRMTLWSVVLRTFGVSAVFRSIPFFNPETCNDPCRNEPFSVDIVTGCFLLIESRFWHDLRGFDPEFFFFGEDADLCLRAIAKGARPVIAPIDAAIHLGGASESQASKRTINMLAARIGLARRHFVPFQGRLVIALTRFGPLLRLAAQEIRSAKTGSSANLESARAVWRAKSYWWEGF